METQKYDHKMLKFADKVAMSMSKDTSTKIGAIVVDGKEIVTLGYNGMPRNINDSVKERIDRNYVSGKVPVKYSWFEHGERNAIYNMAHNASLFKNKVMLISGEIDLEDLRCAISAGIETIFLVKCNTNIINHEESNKIAIEMLSESKTDLIVLNEDNFISSNDDYQICKESFKEELESQIVLDLKVEKLLKKLEIVEHYKDIFSNEHEFKGSDHVVFSKNRAATVIFDISTYSDLSFGVTGLTENLNDIFEKKNGTEEDYSNFSMGSVRNAIYVAINPLMKGKTVYVNLCPCIDCSKAMASVGVKKVVFGEKTQSEDVKARWQKSFDVSINYLKFFNIPSSSVNID